MFDSLCHLPLFPSAEEASRALEAAQRSGVTALLCAGTNPTEKEAIAPCPLPVHRAFGIHPQHANDDALPAQLYALEQRLAEGAIAVGECGLDSRGDSAGMPPLDVQERTFRAQLVRARQRRLPLIMHLVGTWSRAFAIIEEEGPLPAGGMWHAFSGPKEAIAPAEHLGVRLSVGALVRNDNARRLREAIPHIPPSLLLVESDMPHEPAVPIPEVVDHLAALRGETPEAVALHTTDNARALFGL